jgi:hypothetical protein
MNYGKLKIDKPKYLYSFINERLNEFQLTCVELVFKGKTDKWYDIIDRCNKCKRSFIKIGKTKIPIKDCHTLKLELKEQKPITIKVYK